MSLTNEQLAALRSASQKKGAPLNDAEVKAALSASTRETLRLRFLNVIRLAGYKNGGPERICAEYLDQYMQDVPGFIKMLEEYEERYRD